MNLPPKAVTLLRFAQRAGKLTIGATPTDRMFTKGKIHLVLLAHDCSETAKRRLRHTASKHRVTIIACSNKAELGELFGRVEVGILGVTDSQFGKSLKALLE